MQHHDNRDIRSVTGASTGAGAGDLTLLERKAALRQEMLRMRAGLPAPLRQAAAGAIATRLLDISAVQKSNVITVYQSMDTELSLEPTIAGLRARGIKTAFPCLRPGHLMEFYVVEEGETPPYKQDPKGVLDEVDPTRKVPSENIDVMLCPGLAFDQRCNRLGYGAGYYDAFINQIRKGCPLIGIAYDQQMVETVPTDDRDQQMHYVMTPSKMIVP